MTPRLVILCIIKHFIADHQSTSWTMRNDTDCSLSPPVEPPSAPCCVPHHSSLVRRHVKDFWPRRAHTPNFWPPFHIFSQLHFHTNNQKWEKKKWNAKMVKNEPEICGNVEWRRATERCVLELEKLQQLVCLEVNQRTESSWNDVCVQEICDTNFLCTFCLWGSH